MHYFLLLGGMFSWVTSTLVQGEFGRQQACQCSLAQSAQSVGGIALRYEIGCKPFTSLSGPYSASSPKVQILIHFSFRKFYGFCQTCKIQFVKWKQVKISSMIYYKDLFLFLLIWYPEFFMIFHDFFPFLFKMLTIFIYLIAIKYYSWFWLFFHFIH